MLQPAQRKYRKEQKGRNKGLSNRANSVSFGNIGLKSLSRGRINSRQIESARRTISHHTKREGKVWIRVFPDKPISKKPAEVRMGSGKGNPEYYVFEVKPGRILYEILGVDLEIAKEALRLASFKLPFKTTIVHKHSI